MTVPKTWGRYGTASAPASVAPTGSAAQGVAANTARIQVVMINNGAATVYMGSDNTVTTANGIPLQGNGGGYVDDSTTGAWFFITGGATGDVRILEISAAGA